MRHLAALALLAACKSSPHAPPATVTPPATGSALVATPTVDAAPIEKPPAPLPGLADADLALIAGTDVVALSFAKGELGRTKLVDDAGELSAELVWADRTHVVVGYGEQKLALIGTTDSQWLALPTAAAYEAIPKPTKSDDPENLMPGSGEGLAGRTLAPVAKDGAVYWEQCAWGYPYDGFQCALMTSTRIWPADPTHAITTREGDNWEMSNALEDHGWTDAKAAFPVGDADGVPWCKDKTGKKIALAHLTDEEQKFDSAHWVGGSLLLVYGTMGLGFSPSSFARFDACTAKPTLTGDWLALYPDGLWFATVVTGTNDDGESRYAIHAYRGTTKLADLPSSTFALRPTK